MTDDTTIRVTKDAKADAQEAKRDNETWNDYLKRCTDTPPEINALVPAEDVTGEGLTYDDVKAACKDAIEEELGGVLQR